MFDKIFVTLEKLNKADHNNDYVVTKKAGEYIIIRLDSKNDEMWDVGFAKDEKRVLMVLDSILDTVENQNKIYGR